MMKRFLRWLPLFCLLASLLAGTALADFGPKPQLVVRVVNGPEEDYYLDLLAEGELSGGWEGPGWDVEQAMKRGEVQYDFVEVMACPGGCVGGGGQPIHDGQELAKVRGDNLYFLDRTSALRFSHENPKIQALYKEFLGEPLGHKAHELLHTDHTGWKMPGEP